MDADPRFSRALIVANPVAGRERGHAVALRLAKGLRQRGVAAELSTTTS